MIRCLVTDDERRRLRIHLRDMVVRIAEPRDSGDPGRRQGWSVRRLVSVGIRDDMFGLGVDALRSFTYEKKLKQYGPSLTGHTVVLKPNGA